MNQQHFSQPKPHWLSRFLPTPGNVIFTLLAITLAFWAQSVGALPGASTTVAPQQASTDTIAYQGRLTDAAGNPLTGTYDMAFRLYDASTGGTLLWEEQESGGVQVSDGLFNVMLGSQTPITPSIFVDHDSLYLGVVVGSEEMSGRVQLGSVPFAMQALTVADGSVTTDKIADEAVTTAKLNVDNGLEVSGDIKSTGEIYEEYTSVTYTDNFTPRWFRFAQSSGSAGRNSGVFEIRWTRSGKHGHVRFAVGADYGLDSGIGVTILDSSTYYGGLSQIRLLMKDTYDQMYIEGYDAEGGDPTYPITYHIYKYSGRGWSLIDITDGSIPTDYANYEMPTNIVFGARSDSSDIFVFNRAGQVGIGTTSPSEKLHVNGNFVASGTKSAVVDTAHYGQRKLYALEHANNKFVDEGQAKLVNGMAIVTLDPIFLETIEGDFLIHVTPYGKANLYVAEIGEDYFVVNAQEGNEDVEFAWMLTAARKGYADVRLEPVETTNPQEK